MTDLRFRRGALALGLTAVLTLAACGGGTASQPAGGDRGATTEATPSAEPSEAAPTPGTALNACELVSVDDVADMLLALRGEEVPVADGELRDESSVLDPGKTRCQYADEWGGLVVSLTPTDGANLYDAARGAYADAKDLEIAGADSAFWSADTNRGFFWKGSVTVMLQITHTTTGNIDWEEATTMLGQAAIDKL